MKKLSLMKTIEYFCKQQKVWGVYISYALQPDGEDSDSWIKNEEELYKAAPYLNRDKDYQLIFDEGGFILCDSEEEAFNVFDQTVGDDGPTKLNKYNGPMRVYAIVAGPRGFETENT